MQTLDISQSLERNQKEAEKKKHSTFLNVWNTDNIPSLKSSTGFIVKHKSLHEECHHPLIHYNVGTPENGSSLEAIESLDPMVRDAHLSSRWKPPYVISVIDMSTYKKVFRMTVNLWKGVMLIYYINGPEPEKLVGRIERSRWWFPYRFHLFLQSSGGRQLLKVTRSVSGICNGRPKSFQILGADSVTSIGGIEKKDIEVKVKPGNEEDPEFLPRYTFNASFPAHISGFEKALVLGSVLMIDALQTRLPRKRKCSPTLRIVATVIAFVALATVLGLLFGGRGFQKVRFSGRLFG